MSKKVQIITHIILHKTAVKILSATLSGRDFVSKPREKRLSAWKSNTENSFHFPQQFPDENLTCACWWWRWKPCRPSSRCESCSALCRRPPRASAPTWAGPLSLTTPSHRRRSLLCLLSAIIFLSRTDSHPVSSLLKNLKSLLF